MNFNDVRILNDSIQNFGQDALRRRQMQQQHDAEMQRLALESQTRDIQEGRADAQQAHYNQMESNQSDRNTLLAQTESDKAKAALQPKIQAEITHPSTGAAMTFTGTQEALDAMQKADPSIKISNKKSFAAKFDIGGASFQFDDADAAQKFADDMKTKGIDVYNPPAPNVTTLPNGQPVVTDRKGNPKLGAPPPTQTQTMKYPAVPAVPADVTPASGGIFGFGAHPAVTNAPAVPFQPERTITQKIPVNTTGAPVTPAPDPSAINLPAPSPSDMGSSSQLAPPMPTAAPVAQNGLSEGQRVRNKRTGQMGTVKNGVVVPDDAQ